MGKDFKVFQKLVFSSALFLMRQLIISFFPIWYQGTYSPRWFETDRENLITKYTLYSTRNCYKIEATVTPFLFLFYFSLAQMVMLNLQCLVTKQLENLVNSFGLKCHQVFLEKKNDLMRMTQLLVSSNIPSLCKANSSAKVKRRIYFCVFGTRDQGPMSSCSQNWSSRYFVCMGGGQGLTASHNLVLFM